MSHALTGLCIEHHVIHPRVIQVHLAVALEVRPQHLTHLLQLMEGGGVRVRVKSELGVVEVGGRVEGGKVVGGRVGGWEGGRVGG